MQQQQQHLMEVRAWVFVVFCSLAFHKTHCAELDMLSGSQSLTDNDTLVSEGGIFELGFFQADSSSPNRYLSIRYKQIAVKTLVWAANRDQPLAPTSAPVLNVAAAGILVLVTSNTSSSRVIWSSNTPVPTKSRNATAKLLDSGNLVLMDEDQSLQKVVLWQSFDYPTEHGLPGMKLGYDYVRGIKWQLTSWNSSSQDHPVVGEYSWGLADIQGYPQTKLIKQGSVVIHRSRLWRNEQFHGGSIYSRDLIYTYNVTINQDEVSVSYDLQNTSALFRLTLSSSSGKLESWVWVEADNKWQLSISNPRDICDTYNICNAYSSCSFNTLEQSCACLDDKFVPRNKKDWDAGDSSGGCLRRTPLDCKNESQVGFMKYTNVKLPDANGTWFNMSVSMEECEVKCLKNCSCTAYANPDPSVGGGRGCVLWFSDLIDIRQYPKGKDGDDIFIKMDSSELVSRSSYIKKGGANVKLIIPAIFSGVMVMSCFMGIWFWYRRENKNLHDAPIEEGVIPSEPERNEEDMELPLFSFSTISNATANFSHENKLGEGGFGPVYKGVLEKGQHVAVKRLSKNSSQGLDEFKNEVLFISKLQHRNLVKLFGCCIQGDEKLLIYEYMPNKSLDLLIFDKTQIVYLSWTTRFNIIKGIARGLVYLHQDSRLRIIHRDLKASNILLDQDMNPKISDFGIARSFEGNQSQANTQRVVGTYGYMSPEYALDGIFSVKSDVFSFGVMILEIVSGQRNRGFTQQEDGNNLMGHTWSVYNEGRSIDLLDASLVESCHPAEVLRSIQVALLCVQQNAGDRPNMSSVIMMLDGEHGLPQPRKPAYFMESELLVANFSSNTNPEGSISELTITEVDAR